MKIEITNESNGFYIYEATQNRPIRNYRNNLCVNYFSFNEEDILKLLSDKVYKRFEAGQYKFNVTKSHLQLITGERLAQTRYELELYND